MTFGNSDSGDLVLIYSDVRFAQGALLTQQAYLQFLDTASKTEKETHKASLLTQEHAKGLKLEIYGNATLH